MVSNEEHRRSAEPGAPGPWYRTAPVSGWTRSALLTGAVGGAIYGLFITAALLPGAFGERSIVGALAITAAYLLAFGAWVAALGNLAGLLLALIAFMRRPRASDRPWIVLSICLNTVPLVLICVLSALAAASMQLY